MTTLTEEQEWLDRYFGEIECINVSKIACALSRDLCVKGGHASCRSQGWQHAMRNTESFEDFLKKKNDDLLKTRLEENVVSIFQPGVLRNHQFTTVDLMHLSIHHSNSSEIIDDVENIVIQYYKEIVFPNKVKKPASKRSRDDSDSGDSDDSNNNRKKPKPSRKRHSSENDHGDDGQPKKKRMRRTCKEEGCEKYARGGLKGRCKRHGREHGDVYSRPRCKEEGCEKEAKGGMKGRCTRHAREHAEKGGDP